MKKGKTQNHRFLCCAQEKQFNAFLIEIERSEICSVSGRFFKIHISLTLWSFLQ